MIDPGTNRSGFCRDLVDVHDRLDRSVARGQQLAQRSTPVGVSHERARDDTVDRAWFAFAVSGLDGTPTDMARTGLEIRKIEIQVAQLPPT